LPSHILKDTTYENWATHPFHTAANTYTITLPETTNASANSFLDQYGTYAIATAIILVAVAVIAVLLLRRNKHTTKNNFPERKPSLPLLFP
jgi:hypothetical protein